MLGSASTKTQRWAHVSLGTPDQLERIAAALQEVVDAIGNRLDAADVRRLADEAGAMCEWTTKSGAEPEIVEVLAECQALVARCRPTWARVLDVSRTREQAAEGFGELADRIAGAARSARRAAELQEA